MSDGMITCLSCGRQIEAHYLYCPYCQSRADAPAGHQQMAPIPQTSYTTGGYYDTQTVVACTGCGRHVENHYAHCPYCRRDLSLAVAPSREPLHNLSTEAESSNYPYRHDRQKNRFEHDLRDNLKQGLNQLSRQLPPELAAQVKPIIVEAVTRKLLKPKVLLMLLAAVIAGVIGLGLLILLLILF